MFDECFVCRPFTISSDQICSVKKLRKAIYCSLIGGLLAPLLASGMFRPFVKAKPRSLGQMWRTFSEILAEPNTAIVLSFASEDWAHWTVVQDVDDEALWLADSDGMRTILRREVSITKVNAQRPLHIQWRDVFVVSRLTEELAVSGK